jgi:hypothetical protein
MLAERRRIAPEEVRRITVTDALVDTGATMLVGQIPLEALDYVVDLRARRLIGNPDHGGELMYDLYFGPERRGSA